MSQPITIPRVDIEPIPANWTIRTLVAWLSEDTRQHAAELQRPLTFIETALTGVEWRSTPSTVALIRSLASAARTRGDERIVDVLSPPLMPSPPAPAPLIVPPLEQTPARARAARPPSRVA